MNGREGGCLQLTAQSPVDARALLTPAGGQETRARASALSTGRVAVCSLREQLSLEVAARL